MPAMHQVENHVLNYFSESSQCRLLQSAIGNFPGQKVTCPVISSVSLTECPDDPRADIIIANANNTIVRMRWRATRVTTTPILPRG